MKLRMMERLQAEANRSVLDSVPLALSPYKNRSMSRRVWLAVLRLLFGVVEPAAVESARVARRFYDEERARVFPGAPRHDIFLQVPTFERFVEDMEEVYPRFRRQGSTDNDVRVAAMRAARTVENAGRWTIMKAVEEPDPFFDDDGIEFVDSDEEFTVGNADPKDRPKKRSSSSPGRVRGWARVATGRETCGWCLMLVSRGPVYATPKTAGSNLDTREALQTTGSQTFDTKEHMHAWHTGCDCKIVPVFKLNDWEGRSRHKAAEMMWRDVTEGYFGKDAINAFRRAAEAGVYTEYLSKF